MKLIILRHLCLIVLVCFYSPVYSQGLTKQALFLGNSYTYGNNLPQVVADMAASTGDVLNFDSNTPGGYTLQAHSTNTTSLNKIAAGGWDFVVLQEQSQLPSFPYSQVATNVFPFARMLDSLVNSYNPCGETVFFMTWGRKNGDASNCGTWPPVCTYEGMDSLLNLRYRMMADSNEAVVTPAGAVWKYIRSNYPAIELYEPDESHPSVYGTYAAACAFYVTFFRKDPTLISYNSSLNPVDAAIIRSAAKLIVYDSLEVWNIGAYDPKADFNFISTATLQVTFSNTSTYSSAWNWDFGDGNATVAQHPVHNYTQPGSYTVLLTAAGCGNSDTISKFVQVISSNNTYSYSSVSGISLYPNPVSDLLLVSNEATGYNRYRIVNIPGAELMKGRLDIGRNSIAVEFLVPGVYQLQLSDDTKGVKSLLFIKN